MFIFSYGKQHYPNCGKIFQNIWKHCEIFHARKWFHFVCSIKAYGYRRSWTDQYFNFAPVESTSCESAVDEFLAWLKKNTSRFLLPTLYIQHFDNTIEKSVKRTWKKLMKYQSKTDKKNCIYQVLVVWWMNTYSLKHSAAT